MQWLSRPLPPRGGCGTHLGRERCDLRRRARQETEFRATLLRLWTTHCKGWGNGLCDAGSRDKLGTMFALARALAVGVLEVAHTVRALLPFEATRAVVLDVFLDASVLTKLRACCTVGDVRLLLCGATHIDADEWQASAVYDPPEFGSSEQVAWLWAQVRQMSAGDLLDINVEGLEKAIRRAEEANVPDTVLANAREQLQAAKAEHEKHKGSYPVSYTHLTLPTILLV